MKNICRKTNTLFLVMTLVYLLTSLFLSMLSLRMISPPTELSLVLGELIVVVPGIIFILMYKFDITEWIPFKKIKWSTVGFTILITITITPFLYFLNILSQLLVDNVVLDLMGEVTNLPKWMVIFVVGIFGPFCEEMAFRGILFGGFKKSGRVLTAVIWSGFLFGLFHMNLNQFGYAFAIGVISALLIEASGSIWPSLIMHVLINTYNVLQLYVTEFIYEKLGLGFEEVAASEAALSNDNLLRVAALLLLPAVGGIAIAVVLYFAILNREGRREYVVGLFKRKSKAEAEIITEKKPHVVTLSGILGVLICCFVIFAMKYVLNMFGM